MDGQSIKNARLQGRRAWGRMFSQLAGGAQMLKLEPQPQVVLALGLRMTNCEP